MKHITRKLATEGPTIYQLAYLIPLEYVNSRLHILILDYSQKVHILTERLSTSAYKQSRKKVICMYG